MYKTNLNKSFLYYHFDEWNLKFFFRFEEPAIGAFRKSGARIKIPKVWNKTHGKLSLYLGKPSGPTTKRGGGGGVKSGPERKKHVFGSFGRHIKH